MDATNGFPTSNKSIRDDVLFPDSSMANPCFTAGKWMGVEIVRKLADTGNDHLHIYSLWLGLTSTMALHIHLHSITYINAVHDVLGAMTWMRRCSYTGVNELLDNFKSQFVFQQ
jgi:hypothetical protein